jgi:endonuclease YncB( thermonuclease family)
VIGVALLAAAVLHAASFPGGVATPVLGDPWLVTEVVDGDTIDVAQGPRTMTVRLIGINAPESGECWADEAAAALGELVGRGPVWLTLDVSGLDLYGRALRYVVNGDGDDVGARLVEQGAAIATSWSRNR